MLENKPVDLNSYDDDFESMDEESFDRLLKRGAESKKIKHNQNSIQTSLNEFRKSNFEFKSKMKKKKNGMVNWILEGKWTLGENIGKGSFGSVFQCMNDHGKLYAVKRVEMASGRRETVDDLVQEIDLMRGLCHPNIVEYIGASVDEKMGRVYIFQEWVSGGSIAHLLKLFGPFREGAVRNYTRQILQGLAYLHHHGIVHRDIKGGNVLVDESGSVKLADFGASTRLGVGGTQELKDIKGTPYFMAPEVLGSSRYGRKGDIWAVGCTMVQMLTGEPPWKDRNLQGLVQLHFLLMAWPGGHPLSDLLQSQQSSEMLACLDMCFRKDEGSRPTASELLESTLFATADDEDEAYSSDSYSRTSHRESHGGRGGGSYPRLSPVSSLQTSLDASGQYYGTSSLNNSGVMSSLKAKMTKALAVTPAATPMNQHTQGQFSPYNEAHQRIVSPPLINRRPMSMEKPISTTAATTSTTPSALSWDKDGFEVVTPRGGRPNPYARSRAQSHVSTESSETVLPKQRSATHSPAKPGNVLAATSFSDDEVESEDGYDYKSDSVCSSDRERKSSNRTHQIIVATTPNAKPQSQSQYRERTPGIPEEDEGQCSDPSSKQVALSSHGNSSRGSSSKITSKKTISFEYSVNTETDLEVVDGRRNSRGSKQRVSEDSKHNAERARNTATTREEQCKENTESDQRTGSGRRDTLGPGPSTDFSHGPIRVNSRSRLRVVTALSHQHQLHTQLQDNDVGEHRSTYQPLLPISPHHPSTQSSPLVAVSQQHANSAGTLYSQRRQETSHKSLSISTQLPRGDPGPAQISPHRRIPKSAPASLSSGSKGPTSYKNVTALPSFPPASSYKDRRSNDRTPRASGSLSPVKSSSSSLSPIKNSNKARMLNALPSPRTDDADIAVLSSYDYRGGGRGGSDMRNARDEWHSLSGRSAGNTEVIGFWSCLKCGHKNDNPSHCDQCATVRGTTGKRDASSAIPVAPCNAFFSAPLKSLSQSNLRSSSSHNGLAH